MFLEGFLHFRILNLPGVKNMQILNVLKTLYILKSFLSLHLKSEVSSEIPLRYFTFLFLQKPLWLLNFNLPPYHEYIIIITIMILKTFFKREDRLKRVVFKAKAQKVVIIYNTTSITFTHTCVFWIL